MDRATGEVTLLGATLQHPGPLSSVDVRFQSGVDVLYGLNGVGKTRVLRSLLFTLGADPEFQREAGAPTGGTIHAAIRKPSARPLLELPWWHHQLVEAAEAKAREVPARPNSPWLEPRIERLTSALGSIVYGLIAGYAERELLFKRSGTPDVNVLAKWAWAITSQGYLSLEAVDPGRWLV